MTTVTWTKDANNVYEVATKRQLLQIISQGALYTDAGDAPSDYWGSSYRQVADVDLADDHESILPIGNHTTQFTGEYDGGLFKISNWAYVGAYGVRESGLFGHCNGATLTHIRLAGSWSLSNACSSSGFLCGYAEASTIYDVEGHFSSGTIFEGSVLPYCGGLLGFVDGGNLHGLTLRGNVDVNLPNCLNVGGVIGYIRTGATLSHCRNLATFPNGIGSIVVGGVIGTVEDANISNCLNASTGNIVGSASGELGGATTYCGGVCGLVFGTSQASRLLNAMTGVITAVHASGGIVGQWAAYGITTNTGEIMLNYMKGNIIGAVGAGGIVGEIFQEPGDAQVSISKSVVAMHGNVAQSVRGVENIPLSMVEVTVDTSFGMVFDTNDYGSSIMVLDDFLGYHPQFTDLPYFNTSGNDAAGNLYQWDFVYANIGGKYPSYTHLSVHTGEVSAPYLSDLGLGDNNTVAYVTYANTTIGRLYINSSLTVVSTGASWVDFIAGQSADSGQVFPVKQTTKTDFLVNGVYDITEAGTEVLAAANDLFTTGDPVAININHKPKKTTFVNRGGTLDIVGVSALLLPFEQTVADVQDAAIALSDSSSVDIGFDQASGDIFINGTSYSSGDHFVMDSQKVSVFDV